MKYIIDLADNKETFAEEFFKSISFVKKVKALPKNEITNEAILKSIESYEKGMNYNMALNSRKLKKLLCS